MYRVKVEDGEIVVTNPNQWRASYRYSEGVNGMVAVQVVTDLKATVSERARFLGQAFGKATHRARKLGWMA